MILAALFATFVAFQEPETPSAAPAAKTTASDYATPTRDDLARAYLRFEQAWSAHPPKPEAIAEFNRRFDRATLAFFFGKAADALRELDDATFELAPTTPRDLLGLRVEFDPPAGTTSVWTAAEPGFPLRVKLAALYPATKSATPTRLRLTVRSPFEGNDPLAEHVRDSWTLDSGSFEFTASLLGALGSVFIVHAELADRAGDAWLGTWRVLEEPAADVRAGLGRELSTLGSGTKELEAAKRALNSRIARIGERLEFEPWNDEHPVARRERALHAELESLKANHDPYRRRKGDLWRTVRVGDRDLATRVFAPDAACGEKATPLVIALHGAGGDENMFFEGYGNGKIVELAKQHGFLVAAPLVSFAGLSTAAFDSLITELGYDYAIDPARIYVLGHSMGAGAAAGLASSRRERIAAVACFAGGSAAKDRKMSPTRIWAGELDPLAKPEGLVQLATKASAEGAPIECEVVKDYGHTLVVGARLPQAIDWLLAHRLAPNESK